MKLTDLIAPISLNEFKLLFEERPACEIWKTRMDLESLFKWGDLNLVLRQQRINDADVVVLRNGTKVDSRDVTEGVRRKFSMAKQLSRGKLLSVLKAGATIRISGVDEKSDHLESLAIDSEKLLGCRVNINLYAGFGSVPALLAHTDTHDVLVVQLEGEKTWEVFGFGVDHFPIKHPKESDCPTETIWSGTLQKGDLLFMPRGSWHKAKGSKEASSLHITIGFNHTMLRSLPNWLDRELSQQSIYREHLLEWKTDNDSEIEAKIRQILNGILVPGFLSRFREDSRESKPERFEINLPDLET